MSAAASSLFWGRLSDGITEVLGDEFIGLVLGGTSYTFSLTGSVEMIHYYQAAIEFGQLEIIVTAEEAGLSHEVGTAWRGTYKYLNR